MKNGQGPEQRRGGGTPTGLSRDRYLAVEDMVRQQSAQGQGRGGNYYDPRAYPSQAAPQPRVDRYGRQIAPQYGAPMVVYRDMPDGYDRYDRRRKKNRRHFKLGRKAIAGIVIAGVALAGGGVWAYNNPDTVATAAANVFGGGSDAAAEAEVPTEVAPLEKMTLDSLNPDQCELPEAVLMVAKVSGELPLIPMISTTENPTLSPSDEYLTEDFKDDLPENMQDEFEKAITDSGNASMVIKDLPLALTVCAPLNSGAITEGPDGITINKSALEVEFKDPNTLFGKDAVRTVYTIYDALDIDIDSEQGQYLAIQDPTYFMGKVEGDDVYNKSIDDVKAAMANPLQIPILMALAEKDAVTQYKNVVSGDANITFPGTIASPDEAIKDALAQRLGYKSEDIEWTGSFNIVADVPKDPATKDDITKTNPLKGLDPSETIKNLNISIEYGSLTEPNLKPLPTPTPTPEVAVGP